LFFCLGNKNYKHLPVIFDLVIAASELLGTGTSESLNIKQNYFVANNVHVYNMQNN
jgi:hypothetical protein